MYHVLGEAAILGIPVDRLIRSDDPQELALLHVAREQAAEALDNILVKLARYIVKEHSDAEARGAKKRKRFGSR